MALLLLIVPAPVRADALSDLRATLQRLQSDEPLRARVDIRTTRAGGESDKQRQAVGDSSVIVEIGRQGLRMSWSAQQIQQSRAAAAEKALHPDASRSHVATLSALAANDALDLLDAAEPLRRDLEGAVLVSDTTDTYNGKPARLLIMRLDLRLEEEARKLLKDREATLKLWLDPGGHPMGLDRDLRLRFSKFFLSYRVHDEEVREFQLAGGRLVVAHAQHDNSGSGLGHQEDSNTTTTVTLLSGSE